MSNNWFDSNDNNQKSMNVVANEDVHIFEKASNGFPKSSLILPPMNAYASYTRNKSQSSFSATSLSTNSQIDVWIKANGFISSSVANLIVTNNSLANVNFLPQFFANRIEFLDSNGAILDTIYADNLYLKLIHYDINETKRIALAEGFSATTFNSDAPILPSASREYLIEIPSIFSYNAMKLSSLNDRVIVRFYLNSLSADIPSSITITQLDILTRGVSLTPTHEMAETKRKRYGLSKFHFLSPIRVASQTLNLAPNSQYDIRLTSANSYSAYLLMVIRPSVLTYANQNVFQPIDRVELLDQNATIVGITSSNLLLRTVTSQQFVGDIINVKPGIYCIPFATSIKLANNGSVTGYYRMTSNELLRFYTEGTIVPGAYTVSIYSYDYNTAQILDGSLTAVKY